MSTESTEFYKKYRPKTLKGVVGQEAAVRSLQQMVERNKIPHCILFSGPSGVGKTTIARILRTHLDCGDADFLEINCADFKGIDMVRDVRRSANLSPMTGSTRIWLIDECHMLTKDAQNAFLKLLEDTPSHTYFFLATTDPQKLLKTIITRSTEVKLSMVDPSALVQLMQRVLGKEQVEMDEDVVQEIAESSDGSARKALVILEQVAAVSGKAEQLAAIQASTINKDLAIELARALFKGAKWPVVSKLLKEIKDEPEGVRYLILGYARAILLNDPRNGELAFKIIDIFSKNFYDSKQAGLAAACYEAVTR